MFLLQNNPNKTVILSEAKDLWIILEIPLCARNEMRNKQTELLFTSSAEDILF
jgi:hypothetical protein